MNEHVIVALKEMCNRVGADYDSINFKEVGWYCKYEWTQEQEDNYIKWLAKYIKPMKVKMVFTDYPRIYSNERVAKAFVDQLGWKVKRECLGD